MYDWEWGPQEDYYEMKWNEQAEEKYEEYLQENEDGECMSFEKFKEELFETQMSDYAESVYDDYMEQSYA